MRTSQVRDFLSRLFPGDVIINGATTESPSISVFQAPESRSTKTPFVGGEGCDDFRKMPINILVRWSTDTDIAYKKALDIYSSLEGLHNFLLSSVEVAYISMLDDHPVWVGRDTKNVVEYIIRADIYYFMEVSNEAH